MYFYLKRVSMIVQDNVHVNEEQTPLAQRDTEVRVQV